MVDVQVRNDSDQPVTLRMGHDLGSVESVRSCAQVIIEPVSILDSSFTAHSLVPQFISNGMLWKVLPVEHTVQSCEKTLEWFNANVCTKYETSDAQLQYDYNAYAATESNTFPNFSCYSTDINPNVSDDKWWLDQVDINKGVLDGAQVQH